MNLKLVSSDAHIIEPPDLWEQRISPAYADRAPRIHRIDGDDRWLADDRYRMGNLGNAGAAGKRFEQATISLRGRFADIRPGAWDPTARLGDMDLDGVFAEVLYPTVTMHAFRIPDPGLLQAICAAYNDWVAEFCAAAPARFFGAGLVPLDDIEVAIAEATRARAAGLVTAVIPSRPPSGGYDDPRYERFWGAAADLDMPLSLHVGSQRRTDESMSLEGSNVDLSVLVNRDMEIRRTLLELIMGGVFERHPGLRVVALEYEVSWVPHFLFRMDDMYANRAQGRMGYRFGDGILPSDFFRGNIFISFQEDPHLVACLPAIGEGRLVWGSDFPHAESTWPRSQEILGKLLADIAPAARRALSAGNVANLYGIEMPSASVESPPVRAHA